MPATRTLRSRPDAVILPIPPVVPTIRTPRSRLDVVILPISSMHKMDPEVGPKIPHPTTIYTDAPDAVVKLALGTNYPVKAEDRRNYRDSAGRGLSSHTFRVYDACAQIPAGKWSSYKAIAMSIASSPRAVGQALRRNPFSPSPIPCHRVLEAKGGIGGFHGQKSPDSFDRKVALLRKEGLQVPQPGNRAK